MSHRSVISITLEPVSPLILPCYGNRAIHLPTFERLCAQGIVFHEHYAPHLKLQTQDTTAVCVDDLVRRLPLPLNSEQITTAPGFPWSTADNAMSTTVEWTQHIDRQPNQTDNDYLLHVEAQLARLVTAVDHTEQSPAESDNDLLWVITSRTGVVPAVDQTRESVGFTNAVGESLSARLWTPLILAGSMWHNEFTRHVTKLTTPADLTATVQHWLGARKPENSTRSVDDDHDNLLHEPQFKPQPILLGLGNQIGWRTADDLLTVKLDVAQSHRQTPSPPPACLYLKPEDRFDINDVAAANPDTVQQRWNELRTALPT